MAINQPTIAGQELWRPTRVEINLAHLASNYRAIKQHVAPAAVMPVLKANAYGHGLIEVARLMAALGAPYLGVAFIEEGILLREAGISTPILVLGGIGGKYWGGSVNQIPLFLEYDLTPTVSSIEKLADIDSAARQAGTTARIHLKIDTGMERIGTHYYNAPRLLEAALNSDHCRVTGIYSHFASSESADLTSARIQLQRFNDVLAFYEQRGLPPPARHMANSGAILQLPESHFDMVRPGIMLYGVYPARETPRTIVVRPALSWKSQVAFFKVVRPGHPVSYGGTWQSDHPVRIVTVPAGYGDGYFRCLSNKAEVLINGRRYPVVGRVCMDQMMVNLEWDSAFNGDEVTLIGRDGDETITCDDVAGWAGTISYEVLTNINTRVPRIYLGREEALDG